MQNLNNTGKPAIHPDLSLITSAPPLPEVVYVEAAPANHDEAESWQIAPDILVAPHESAGFYVPDFMVATDVILPPDQGLAPARPEELGKDNDVIVLRFALTPGEISSLNNAYPGFGEALQAIQKTKPGAFVTRLWEKAVKATRRGDVNAALSYLAKTDPSVCFRHFGVDNIRLGYGITEVRPAIFFTSNKPNPDQLTQYSYADIINLDSPHFRSAGGYTDIDIPQPLKDIYFERAREIKDAFVKRYFADWPGMTEEISRFAVEPTVKNFCDTLKSLGLGECLNLDAADRLETAVSKFNTSDFFAALLRLEGNPHSSVKLAAFYILDNAGKPKTKLATLRMGPFTIAFHHSDHTPEMSIHLNHPEEIKRNANYPNLQAGLLFSDFSNRSVTPVKIRLGTTSCSSNEKVTEWTSWANTLINTGFAVDRTSYPIIASAYSGMQLYDSEGRNNSCLHAENTIQNAVKSELELRDFNYQVIMDTILAKMRQTAINKAAELGLKIDAIAVDNAVKTAIKSLPANMETAVTRLAKALIHFEDVRKDCRSINPAAGEDPVDWEREKLHFLLYTFFPEHPGNPQHLQRQSGSYLLDDHESRSSLREKIWQRLSGSSYGILHDVTKGATMKLDEYRVAAAAELPALQYQGYPLAPAPIIANLPGLFPEEKQDLYLVRMAIIDAKAKEIVNLPTLARNLADLITILLPYVASQILVSIPINADKLPAIKSAGVPFRLTPQAYRKLKLKTGEKINEVAQALFDQFGHDQYLRSELRKLGFKPPEREVTRVTFESYTTRGGSGGIFRGAELSSTHAMDKSVEADAKIDLKKIMAFAEWVRNQPQYSTIHVNGSNGPLLGDFIQSLGKMIAQTAAGQNDEKSMAADISRDLGEEGLLLSHAHTTQFTTNGYLDGLSHHETRLYSQTSPTLYVGADGQVFWSAELKLDYESMFSGHWNHDALDLITKPAPDFTTVTNKRRTLLGSKKARVVASSELEDDPGSSENPDQEAGSYILLLDEDIS